MTNFVSFEGKYARTMGLSPSLKRPRNSLAGEDCAICFSKLEHPIGRLLSVCKHGFCLDCIKTWAERSNQCPLCKRTFKMIVCGEGDVADIIDVKTPKKDTEEAAIDAFFDELVCQICEEGGDDSRLLLCDGCDRGFHTYCLRPRLLRVPSGAWYCAQCRVLNSP